jgi:thiamine kinase-like enzyme
MSSQVSNDFLRVVRENLLANYGLTNIGIESAEQGRNLTLFASQVVIKASPIGSKLDAVYAWLWRSESLRPHVCFPILNLKAEYTTKILHNVKEYSITVFPRFLNQLTNYKEEVAYQLGGTLQMFHSAVVPQEISMSPIYEYNWLNLLPGVIFNEQYESKLVLRLEKVTQRIYEFRSSWMRPCSFIHGDIFPNFTISKNKILLFDFEDCGLGEPGFDLVSCNWATSVRSRRWKLQYDDNAATWKALLTGYLGKRECNSEILNSFYNLLAYRILWEIYLHLKYIRREVTGQYLADRLELLEEWLNMRCS